MFISSCVIILIFFSKAIYCVVQEDGIVGAGVLCVPTIGYGAVNLRSTLCGAVPPKLCAGDAYITIVDTSGLFRRT